MTGTLGAAMQFIEASIIGLRSAVITLRHRTAKPRFMIFPMVHVGEQAFYDEVAARARQCQLIVAEGAPSRFAPAQAWMARIRRDRMVDQLNALDLEALGVPVRWEVPDISRSPTRSLRDRLNDPAAAVALKLLGRYGSPLDVSGVDQADAHDWDGEDSFLGRILARSVLYRRDEQLIRVLSEIHRDRSTEPGTVAVVYGAAHAPAAVGHLTGTLRYYVEHAEWLTVANG